LERVTVCMRESRDSDWLGAFGGGCGFDPVVTLVFDVSEQSRRRVFVESCSKS
jgi:hypothetical protein